MILNGLNDSQRKAVTTTDGPLLVVAGPGTGKTLTIVRRIAYLIDQGVAPGNVLAVTFTNRAAREMNERVNGFIGRTASGIFIGTFHVLGLKILKDVMTGDFTLCDRDKQIGILKNTVAGLRDSGASFRPASYAKLADSISAIKCGTGEADDELKAIFEMYESALAEIRAFDFDDLILRPSALLENDDLAERYRDAFKYIIVDEYQDINTVQYNLLQKLTGNTCNICAVGDSDQAIYAFRGADIGNFLEFRDDFSGAEQITLTENYRSTKTILDASGSLIKKNIRRPERELGTSGEKGSPVRIISVPDERSGADVIIRGIEQRMGGTSHHKMRSISEEDFSDRSFRFSDFAVIYRTNAQARAIEESLNQSGIPYQVVGGKKSLQAKAMEDTLSYLRSLTGESAKPEDGVTDIMETVLSPADLFDPSADAVALMTMHMAKGLEFRVVFIEGVENGLLPYTLKDDDIDIEEERRLFYVGMTRAKDELFLIHARKRFLYGRTLTPSPSPFIDEISAEHVSATVVPDRVKKKKEDSQIGLF